MKKDIKSFIGYFSVIALAVLGASCDNNLKQIQQFNQTSFFPVGEAQDIHLQYVDSGRVKAILVGKQMLDYSNVSNPFTEFPEGVHVTFFDKQNNKSTVVANYAISYSTTELIDLRGDVVITTHEGKKLEADQLYYDQKNNWLYTLGKYKASTDAENFTQGIGLDFNSNLDIVRAQNSYAESIKKQN
ncbi:LPS export ABC transporter periplasmic protein LptC [Myroides sp. LJL115]